MDSGHFTQLDPIKDGVNWYVYVDGNPMVGVDPWGTETCHEACDRIAKGAKEIADDISIGSGISCTLICSGIVTILGCPVCSVGCSAICGLSAWAFKLWLKDTIEHALRECHKHCDRDPCWMPKGARRSQ